VGWEHEPPHHAYLRNPPQELNRQSTALQAAMEIFRCTPDNTPADLSGDGAQNPFPTTDLGDSVEVSKRCLLTRTRPRVHVPPPCAHVSKQL